MDKPRGTRTVRVGFLIFWTALFLLGGFPSRGLDLPSSRADVIYEKEGLRGDSDWPIIYAQGDYNGDGFNEIVMIWDSGSYQWKGLMISGGPAMSGGNAEERAVTTLSFQNIQNVRNLEFYSADLDNDGRDDMIFNFWTIEGGQPRQFVHIYYGNADFHPIRDIGLSPDWEIVTESTTSTISRVAAGDVTGDGNTDLLIGSPLDNAWAGEVFLIPGTGSRRTGVFNASSGPGVIRFIGPGGSSRLGHGLSLGDFNNDGIRDILFPVYKDPPGRSNAGMGYVVFGSTALPPVWNFSISTHAPNVEVWGDAIQFSALAAGDMNGDGRDEIYIQNAYPDPDIANQTIDVLIPGTAVNSGAAVIDLRITSPNFRPVVEVDRHGPLGDGFLTAGDFDGDKRADLASTLPSSTSSSSARIVPIRLSSGIKDFPVPVLSTGSFVVKNIFGNCQNASMGDVNGDGFDDLVLGEKGATGTFWALVIYGFRPLDNPSIRFRERGLSPTERQVVFSVDGNPVEMRLDGDGDPLIVNRWIPYERTLRLPLPPGKGERSVGVTFRNRFGRESSRAQDTVTLGIEGVHTRPLTTVLRRGGAPIRIECQLSSPGHLNVWVIDRQGSRIATLFDGDRATGVWPVDWDGRNGAGELVAPGIYILHIESPDVSETKPLVVK